MKVVSYERTTGRGARTFVALLTKRGWTPFSQLSFAVQKAKGLYEVDVKEGVLYASFYRSNSGNEEVTVFQDGVEIKRFYSFEEAETYRRP